jgi:hypothetical protein
MRPEVAVATMLRAMTRRDREVVYTWRGKIGQWIRLIAPSLTDRMAARAIKTGV